MSFRSIVCILLPFVVIRRLRIRLLCAVSLSVSHIDRIYIKRSTWMKTTQQQQQQNTPKNDEMGYHWTLRPATIQNQKNVCTKKYLWNYSHTIADTTQQPNFIMQKRFFFPLNFYFLSLVSERSTKSACVHGSCSCSCLCFIILFYVSSNGIFVLLCMPNHCSMNRMPFVTSFLIHFVCIHIQLDSVFVSLSLTLSILSHIFIVEIQKYFFYSDNCWYCLLRFWKNQKWSHNSWLLS